MADFAFTNTFTNGTLADATEVNANNTQIANIFNGNADSYVQVPSLVPIGAVVGWLKTFSAADSGTTDGTTASKLVQSGQNFDVTCLVGMVIHNTTDDTFAYITAIDSATTLSISADIMVSGEAYTIYKTPNLPDGWAECDGSVLSDADSPYNGDTLPDLNTTPLFLRSDIASGGTGGSDTSGGTTSASASRTCAYLDSSCATGGHTHTFSSANIPTYYAVVQIMRVK